MSIVEIRRQINEIEQRYAELVAPIKEQLKQLEIEKSNELFSLQQDYNAMVLDIVERVENKTYEKIEGVSIRKLHDVVVENAKLLPNHYFKVEVDIAKIKAKMKETDYSEEIDGVKVITKYSVAVTAK